MMLSLFSSDLPHSAVGRRAGLFLEASSSLLAIETEGLYQNYRKYSSIFRKC